MIVNLGNVDVFLLLVYAKICDNYILEVKDLGKILSTLLKLALKNYFICISFKKYCDMVGYIIIVGNIINKTKI